MMLWSIDTTRIIPHFMLPQSCKTFGIRETPAPLLPHVLAGPKVIHPKSCLHDVVSDLSTLVSYHYSTILPFLKALYPIIRKKYGNLLILLPSLTCVRLESVPF